MKHIIDTDELDKLLRYWSDGRMCYMIKVDELNALIANSPQADGMVLVPSEPTEEMKYAAVKEAGDIILKEVYPNGKFKQAVSLDSEMFGTAYKAMLSAYRPQADDVRKDAWISVEDRLPENNVDCLVYFGMNFDLPQIDVAGLRLWSRAENKMLWHGHGGSHNEVTHWQPLPAPPLDKATE